MFRFEMVCDDKKLADVLRAITGLATITAGPQPVVNAKLRNGKLTAQTNGNTVELFDQWLHKEKIDSITGRTAKTFLQTLGRSAASSSYLIKESEKAGLLHKLRVGPPSAGGTVYAVRSQRKVSQKKPAARRKKKKTAPRKKKSAATAPAAAS